MNTEETTETVIPELSPEQIKRRDKINEQLNRFKDTENTLATCRAFWDKHSETILQFNDHTLYGWHNELSFSAYSQDPKAIAKAFGADGWVRERDPHSCGKINWRKVVDGVDIVIQAAERAPELRAEVRLA